MVAVGDIVRYAQGWFEPGEEKYLFIVCELRLNPVTCNLSRALIRALNTNFSAPFQPTEDVEDFMVSQTGVSVKALSSGDWGVICGDAIVNASFRHISDAEQYAVTLIESQKSD